MSAARSGFVALLWAAVVVGSLSASVSACAHRGVTTFVRYAVEDGSDLRTRINEQTDTHASYSFAFYRERAPVSSALRAIHFDSSIVLAAGDVGTIVSRTPTSQWIVERSGSHTRLNAFGETKGGKLFVVGAGGTILSRDFGRWAAVSSPTTRDLYTVGKTQQTVFAAGKSGTLLKLAQDHWINVDSHCDDSLRTAWDCSFNRPNGGGEQEAICLAGDRGRLLRCSVAGSSVDCENQAAPTVRSLYASAGRFVVGEEGAIVEMIHSVPFTAELVPQVTGESLLGMANQPGISALDYSRIEGAMAVGAHGTFVWMPLAGQPRAFTLSQSPDLLAIAGQALDWFIVGANGSIVHAVIERAIIQSAVAL